MSTDFEQICLRAIRNHDKSAAHLLSLLHVSRADARRHQRSVHLRVRLEPVLQRVGVNVREGGVDVVALAIKLDEDGQRVVGPDAQICRGRRTKGSISKRLDLTLPQRS